MKKLLSISIILALSAAAVTANAELRPRMAFEKYLFADGVNPEARYLDRLMIKFLDEDQVRIRNGKLESLNGANLSAAESFLANHPEISLELTILSESEEDYAKRTDELEQNSGKDLVDLFSFIRFKLPVADKNPKALLAEILEAPEVEIAYYESIPFDMTCTDLGTTTPDFMPNQTYHNPAPQGTDLDYARANFGDDLVDGTSSTWTAIFERGMQTTHENVSTATVATAGTPDSNNDHGTAVMGILGGCDDNDVGVLGFLADQQMRLYQRNSGSYGSVQDIYNLANSELLPGEVTNSSWGYTANPMPAGQSCVCNPGQNGSVPIEYDPGVKSAVEAGVIAGIHYFISAGNGCVDLDNVVFGNLFDWSTDSGSVLVGASESPVSGSGHDPACFTTFGSRVTSYAWGENIYSSGYGNAHSGSAGVDEAYTAVFGGTSGASPTVAGCAGIMNNIWRNQNSSANIAPSTMRTWLQQNGTPCNTALEIGVMPNLHGILAPDLQPFAGSWAESVIASNITGDNLIPANLQPSPDLTYLDARWYNASRFEAAGAFAVRIYRDDVIALSYSPGGLGAYSSQFGQDDAISVRGGRHHLRLQLDTNDSVDESLEDNNSDVVAYVWDGMPLVKDAPVNFTRGPKRTPTGFAYNSCDGFSNNGNLYGYWEVFGVMPENSADYDIRLHSEVPSSTNGYDTYDIASAGILTVDFIGVNNHLNTTADYVSTINYTDSDEDYSIEGDASTYYPTVPASQALMVSGAIDAGEILDVIEFPATAGEEIFFALDITSGNADLAVFVFNPSVEIFRRSGASWTLNDTGSGLSESGIFTASESGDHGFVICKNLREELAENASYDLYWGPPQGDLVHATKAGWDNELVPRNSGVGSAGILPVVLNEGNSAADNSYLNIGSGTFQSGSNVGFYLDGPTISTSGNFVVNIAPGLTGWIYAQSLGYVKGGRHEVGARIDANSEVAEELPNGENNNLIFEQFCWAPNELVTQAPLLRSPAPAFRNFNNPDSFLQPANNQDGYTINPSFWSAVATCPVDAIDQYNVRGYDYHSSDLASGLIGEVSLSFAGPGKTAFVMANGNHLYGDYDFGVNYEYGYPTVANDDYVVEGCRRILDLQLGNSFGPATITSGSLIHTYDILLEAGTYPVFLDNISGENINIAIFDQALDYADIADAMLHLASGSNGVDEYGSLMVLNSGYYGVAIYKEGYTDIYHDSSYYISFGERTPANISDLTITPVELDPIDSNYHFDFQFSDVTEDTGGNPLEIDYYQIFWSFDPYASFPSGSWHAATTNVNSEFLNAPTITSELYLRVIAVDTDGRVAAASGGSNMPNMTIVEFNSRVSHSNSVIVGEME
jgi:serine protease